MQQIIKASLVAAPMLLALPAHATTIDTGAGPDYGGGTTLEGPSSKSPYWGSIAGMFTLPTQEKVTSVAGWMNWNYPGSVTFSIFSDVNQLPGTTLHSTTIDVPVTSLNHPDWRGPSQLTWELAAGTYWLAISVPDDQSAFGSMPFGDLERPLSAYAVNYTYSNGYVPAGANYGMRVFASPVPEPSATVLAICGAIVLLFRARRSLSR